MMNPERTPFRDRLHVIQSHGIFFTVKMSTLFASLFPADSPVTLRDNSVGDPPVSDSVPFSFRTMCQSIVMIRPFLTSLVTPHPLYKMEQIDRPYKQRKQSLRLQLPRWISMFGTDFPGPTEVFSPPCYFGSARQIRTVRARIPFV